MKVKNSFILLFVLLAFEGVSQPFFKYYDSVEVKIGSNNISLPWAGGLNFVQVSEIDLNLDGIKDLFVFDRTGNKIRTFINGGTPNNIDYKYAQEYEFHFPKLSDWALLRDYNCDGKEDIFTFTNGGIRVFKNISTLATGLQFQLADSLLHSVYNPDSPSSVACSFGSAFQCNLYVSAVDIPSITDIDNDGDLDIITFAITGTYLEYHQNYSIDSFGVCDSLKFRMRNRCWGYAGESSLSNVFSLHDTCTGNVLNPQIIGDTAQTHSVERHSGNCILCIDFDGDFDKDIVVGSISFNNLTALTNGGTPLNANWVTNDISFPQNNLSTIAVALDIFPCAFFMDVNNDGEKDLIVSPNSTNASQNFNSLVLFKNLGTTASPNFQHIQNNFLQDQMIEVGEGAYPALFDYDNDGLLDLFVGSFGYYDTLANFKHKISQYHNIGTTNVPKFELITRDYMNLSSLGIINPVPAFGDLDNDGDKDLIIGASNGHIHYFRNIAPIGGIANFVLSVTNFTNSLGNIIDVGDYAAPQIVDVDGDFKNDLIIGGRNGKINYLHHIGTATATTPTFDSITNYFGNVDVRQTSAIAGYAYPCLFKESGNTRLIVGDEVGYLYFFDSIDGNIGGSFHQVSSMYQNLFQGSHTSPSIADIDNDGYNDMILGNYEGGLTYYKGVQTLVDVNENNSSSFFNFYLFPNPVNSLLNIKIESDSNLFSSVEIYNCLGQIIYSEKTNHSAINISTSHIGNGIYICKVSNIRGSKYKRLIICH